MKKILLLFALMLSVLSVYAKSEWHDVTITVYNAVPEQTDDSPLITACNKKIDLDKLKHGKLRWIAVSRDLLEKFPYGSSVYLWIEKGHPKNGSYIVRDTLHKRFKNTIDILTYDEKYGKWEGKLQMNP